MNEPQLEQPQCGLLSPIDSDIVSFFTKLSSDLFGNFLEFVRKVTIYLQFLRLQRKNPLPAIHASLANRAKLCSIIQKASSAEVHQELDRLFNEGFDGKKEVALPVLREALVVSRSDRRFSLPQKKEIQKLLLETAFFDESLEESQKQEVQKAIESFSTLYEMLLQDQLTWGLSQTNPTTIQETLLIGSGLTIVLPSLPPEEQEALLFFIGNLTQNLLCLNMFREEWQSQEGLSSRKECQPPDSPLLTIFLFFLIRTLPPLTANEPPLLSFLFKAPGLLAFASTTLSPFLSFFESTSTCLIQAASTAHLLTHISSRFLFQKASFDENELSRFMTNTPPPPLPLLAGFLHVWHSLFPKEEKETLVALIVFLEFDAMVTYLLQHPNFTPQQESFWDMEQLTLSQFINAQKLPERSTYTHPTDDPSPLEESYDSSFKEGGIIGLLQAISVPSFWPEFQQILSRTLKTVRIKKQLGQSEWDELMETGDSLLKTLFSEQKAPSFYQLFRVASEQAHFLKTYVDNNVK